MTSRKIDFAGLYEEMIHLDRCLNQLDDSGAAAYIDNVKGYLWEFMTKEERVRVNALAKEVLGE